MKPAEIWEVEMFIDNEWIKQLRIYYAPKNKKDFDLHDVPMKRRNAKRIG